MRCPNCGAEAPDASHCPACGHAVSPVSPPGGSSPGPPPAPQWGPPVGPAAAPPPGWGPAPAAQPQPWGQPAQPAQPAPSWAAPPWGGPNPGSAWETPRSDSNVLSIIGIVCGVIAVLLIPFLFGLAGIVLGIIAMNRRERLGKVALAVSIGGLVVGVILGVIVYSSQIG